MSSRGGIRVGCHGNHLRPLVLHLQHFCNLDLIEVLGIQLMSLGERAILHISYEYGYGARGMPPVIPGLSNLIFDVELLEIRE